MKSPLNQKQELQIKFNDNQGLYSISFGRESKLIDGIIKIRHRSNDYCNYKTSKTHSKLLRLISSTKEEGDDKLGAFKSINARFQLEDEERDLFISIKHYNHQNFIIFELFIPEGLIDISYGKKSKVVASFPSFINKIENINIFTYRDAIFCPPSRKIEVTSAPVIFYDDNLNCVVLSPLDGFLNTTISKEKNGRINCGIQGEIKELPENFSQRFILLCSEGINQSLENLGDIILKYHDSKRKNLYANIVTSYLGFWTDNGGYYYYKTEKGMNYEKTMMEIKDFFDKNRIPIRYYNFDSWWYLKHTNKFLTTLFRPLVRLMGGGLYGNTLKWEADPKNFTTDLKVFNQEKFKKPIIAHNRRWHAESPYVKQFGFEIYKNHAVPLKKEFWLWVMNHAKERGIEVYEQDWIKNQISSMPILRQDFHAKEDWLDAMATSSKMFGIDIFYCMQTPGILLYSVKHPNVNISRCSGDYNPRWPLTYRFIHSTQTNILFNAIGINSHPDVFRSRTTENVKLKIFREKYPNFKCLYQILNAGIVAPGDKKENVNWPLLIKTCRDDGLLLKPDKSITANDLMFKKHKKYYICDTLTCINNLIWRYILIINIWPRRVKETNFTLDELGFEKNNSILYDFHSFTLNRIKYNDIINIGKLKKYQYKYYIISPIMINGMALIGCPDKFVSCSKKLIKQVLVTENSLYFTVENIKDTKVRLLIYSEEKPSFIYVDNDVFNSWDFSKELNKIALELKFDKNSIKEVLILK
ncbi:MAG: hypothetical protein ACFFEY_04185 [Candidatus Thorarchaeota archaeon]